MNSQELKQHICRICLDENVAIDWNTTLYGYCDITYKDCFYKYTQLECLVLDPFSPMLCQICLDGLYNTHTLILKALESYNYFQKANVTNLIDNSIQLKDYVPTEFETILVEKVKDEPIVHDYERSDEKWCKNADVMTAKQEKCKKSDGPIKQEKLNKYLNESDIKHNSKSKKSQRNTTKGPQTKLALNQIENSQYLRPDSKVNGYTNKQQTEVLEDDLLDSITKSSESSQVKPKEKKRHKEIKKPRMCSICSKILQNNYAVLMHEKTHMENRERKETCKVCGLKFYDKRNLYTHNRIHMENRQKNHKCEFCNKSFYNKGGLNIHRRIHLGQMIPCSLCTKQFFRQIDLERHMSSHSATAISSDTKKRSRYFVRCKHCGKSILSTSFKSHTAAHLNEPLMKCSICSKEFFRRGSCVIHVKKVHQKTNEEYNDFIIQYKKNRISHLFLEQTADIQSTGE